MKNTKLTEENLKSIVKAVSPDIEIKYIQIFDRNEWDQEKEEWVPSDVSVHIRVSRTDMGFFELQKFLDNYTGIDWMIDSE